ncbi:hypothetical protein [Streptomyces sp. NPDC047065]|uniref:hypothetical protein n=1 Tax=Streptomyces sp. NPDC047065 TaxID=3154606 RepID=UPI0033EF0F30
MSTQNRRTVINCLTSSVRRRMTRVAVVRLPLVEYRFQTGNHGRALSWRQVGAVVVWMVEQWRQRGGNTAPLVLSAEPVHFGEGEPLGLTQPLPEHAEAGV